MWGGSGRKSETPCTLSPASCPQSRQARGGRLLQASHPPYFLPSSLLQPETQSTKKINPEHLWPQGTLRVGRGSAGLGPWGLKAFPARCLPVGPRAKRRSGYHSPHSRPVYPPLSSPSGFCCSLSELWLGFCFLRQHIAQAILNLLCSRG